METICRTILVYCLNHYKGDENIKSFIWDLITPTADGQTRALVNHSGMLSASYFISSAVEAIKHFFKSIEQYSVILNKASIDCTFI